MWQKLTVYPPNKGRTFVKNMAQSFRIPEEISRVTEGLEGAGFEAYLVGGCVRDLLRGQEPKDWDVTTNARPEQIQAVFDHTYYTNEFGTVGVVNETDNERLKVVEVTPYRLEGAYSDARRPDDVVFSDKMEDDLKRRDFTINAIAYSISKGQMVDLFQGQKDIKDMIVRAVGEPEERFREDALRILRAVRLATELGFTINTETAEAIKKAAAKLEKISKERIRDELVRILITTQPMNGLITAHELGILRYILPALEEGIGIEQNQAHSYEVWEHNLRALQHAADKNFSLDVRLAALLHDISKPETRRWSDEKKDWTFHGHDVVGSRRAHKMLTELKFPVKQVEKVALLIRWHLFYSDIEKITPSAVRRLVRNVGKENIWDLMDLRLCDRMGTGRPKEQPYRLRKYFSLIEEVMRDPISVGMLEIGGTKIMEVTHEKPGPRVGLILHALLEEVLDAPARNSAEYLENRAQELAQLPDTELTKLGERGKQRRETIEGQEKGEIRQKYWVK